jgi:hypothetical protein
VTGLVTPRIVNSPSIFASPSFSTRTAVETKSMVGWFSASKKSLVRRCWSRFGSLVSIETMVAWAFTELCSGVAPVTISASKSLNVPLTLLIMMWRMLKPTELWVLSMVQVPAMYPGTVVVSLMCVPFVRGRGWRPTASGICKRMDPTSIPTFRCEFMYS